MQVRVISGPQVVLGKSGVIVAVAVLVIEKSDEQWLSQGGFTVAAMALNDRVPAEGSTVDAFVIEEAIAKGSPLAGFKLVMR